MEITSRRIESIHGHINNKKNLFLRNTSKDSTSGPFILKKERLNASFSIRIMTYFLDGGEKYTIFKEKIMNELIKYNELNDMGIKRYNVSHQEKREITFKKIRRLYQLIKEDYIDIIKRNIRVEIYGLYDMNWYVRNGVHFSLFIGTILSQGNKIQQDTWLPLAYLFQIFGSFAMTELGHGSYIKGLETIAEYDIISDEFIIHTPTDTATKWWIGAAGETATHTICYAQLIINNENKGIHCFFIQIRDLETHEPLENIKIGDCGMKMGLNGIDNGWIQFDNHRIPRFNMLCKHNQVLRDGTYITNKKKKKKKLLANTSLIKTRGNIIMLCCNMLKKALMIAIRYSIIRYQGICNNTSNNDSLNNDNNNNNCHEISIIEYRTHQHRLIPLLAMTYAYHFQVNHVQSVLQDMENNTNFNNDTKMIYLLEDIHATMAGLKAFGTWTVQNAIEECRQCCGGHGYSSYNALGSLLADFTVMVTFEGDNTVMAQQTARYLIESFRKFKNNERLTGSVEYLMKEFHGLNTTKKRSWHVQSKIDILNSINQIDALQYLVANKIYKAFIKYTNKLSFDNNNNNNEWNAWNSCQLDMIDIARIHVSYNVSIQFINQINSLKNLNNNNNTHPYISLIPILEKLCNLYILKQIEIDLLFYLENEFMNKNMISNIKELIDELCLSIRQDALPLVDSFNYTDEVLNSCIGKKDGDIYTSYLNAVTNELSHKKPTTYFHKHILPMLKGEDLPNS